MMRSDDFESNEYPHLHELISELKKTSEPELIHKMVRKCLVIGAEPQELFEIITAKKASDEAEKREDERYKKTITLLTCYIHRPGSRLRSFIDKPDGSQHIGLCGGTAFLALRAILLDDIFTFNERLLFIFEKLIEKQEKSPKETFKSFLGISNMFEIRQKAISEIEANLASKNNGEKDIENSDLFENELEKVIATKMDLLAFYDGVNLGQDADKVADKFLGLKNGSRYQNHIFLHSLLNDDTRENIVICNKFSNVYQNREELITCFRLLRESLSAQGCKKNIGFTVKVLLHIITLGWDPNQKCWLIFDVNHPGIIRKDTDNEIVRLLEDALSFGNKDIICCFHLYANECDANNVKRSMADLQRHDEWTSLHDATKEKIKKIYSMSHLTKDNSDKINWLQIAAMCGDIDTVKKIHKIQPSLFDQNKKWLIGINFIGAVLMAFFQAGIFTYHDLPLTNSNILKTTLSYITYLISAYIFTLTATYFTDKIISLDDIRRATSNSMPAMDLEQKLYHKKRLSSHAELLKTIGMPQKNNEEPIQDIEKQPLLGEELQESEDEEITQVLMPTPTHKRW